jgi:hypothetical protein
VRDAALRWAFMWSGSDRMWLVDDEIHDELRGTLDVQARLLYGLIHARWIVTARGLAKMVHPTCFTSKISQGTHLFCSAREV